MLYSGIKSGSKFGQGLSLMFCVTFLFSNSNSCVKLPLGISHRRQTEAPFPPPGSSKALSREPDLGVAVAFWMSAPQSGEEVSRQKPVLSSSPISPGTHQVTDELLLFRLKHKDTEFVIATKHSKASGKYNQKAGLLPTALSCASFLPHHKIQPHPWTQSS